MHSLYSNRLLMHKTQLFIQNKYHILQSKKQYLQEYIKQIQNSIASVWEANQLLKTRIHQLKAEPSQKYPTSSESAQQLEAYKREQREKHRKLEELKRLIKQYKFLCSEAARYTTASSQVTTNFSTDNQSINRSLTPSRSRKKITTKLYCQKCQTYFFPQQYYRHCQEIHNEQPAYQSLRA